MFPVESELDMVDCSRQHDDSEMSLERKTLVKESRWKLTMGALKNIYHCRMAMVDWQLNRMVLPVLQAQMACWAHSTQHNQPLHQSVGIERLFLSLRHSISGY